MLRSGTVALALILSTMGQAASQYGPPIGSAPFKPVLGFNPACTHKGMPPPVPQLGVIKYEDKVYGYVRYCALPTPDGIAVTVKIINEWTNGHGIDGDTLCSAHAWMMGESGRVLFVTHKVGVKPRGSRLLIDEIKMPKTDFDRVTQWTWRFEACRTPRPKFCFGSTACEHQDWYPQGTQ
jgi:hypothetical protein